MQRKLLSNEYDSFQAGNYFAFLLVAQMLFCKMTDIFYSSCKYVCHKYKMSLVITTFNFNFLSLLHLILTFKVKSEILDLKSLSVKGKNNQFKTPLSVPSTKT